MASSSKKRTTMAKIARENKLRERRIDKQAKKDRRKQAAADGPLDGETTVSWLGEPAGLGEAAGEESDETTHEAQPAEAGETDT
jgi:hypothetical protein